MKNLKRILALILSLTLVFVFTACTFNENIISDDTSNTTVSNSNTNYSGEKINVAAIKGPTGMGMVKLMDNDKYNFTLTSDPTEIVSLIATKTVDIAACPLNVAANLYKKTNGNIKMLAINTLGVLYVVSNNVTLKSMSDLEGKTVYATGQGTTVEFILNYLIEKNGLKNTKIEYLSEHSELTTKLVSGDALIAVLPEPFVTVATTKNENVKVQLSLTDEWNKVNPDTELAMGCVIVRADYAKENPDAVKEFISDNRASVEYVNTNSYDASKLMVKNGIIDEAVFAVSETNEKKAQSAASEKASNVISRCNIVFLDAETMKNIANANYDVYFSANPASIGGEMVSDSLYYEAK